MNRTPSASPASKIGTMFGWSTAAAARDSLMNRCRKVWSRARSGARIFRSEEQARGSFACLEDRDDVRVVDGRGGPRLPDEPLPEGLVKGEVRGQDLQCDPSVKPDVAVTVDDSHPAPADQFDYLVPGYRRARREVVER